MIETAEERTAPRLALFQPDIPQNAGTLIRLCACLGVAIDLIEPAGFDLSDRNFRRAGMDYLERAAVARHDSFAAFDGWRRASGARLVLVETDGAAPYASFAFHRGDILLMGRESAGVTPEARAAAETSVFIPQRPGLRSINVALAAAMVLGEALRQTGGFPVPLDGQSAGIGR
jgi:tRNA (cytidine/uridine-2'-O-)-methyltransferase